MLLESVDDIQPTMEIMDMKVIYLLYVYLVTYNGKVGTVS